MTSSSTPTTGPQKTPEKAPSKKTPSKKTAGSSRVAALASKLATSPGSVKATASLPATSGDLSAAAASLMGLSPAVVTAPVPRAADNEPPLGIEQAEADAVEADAVEADAVEAVPDSFSDLTGDVLSAHRDETPIKASAEGLVEKPDQSEPETDGGRVTQAAAEVPQPLALVPDPAPASPEEADTAASPAGEDSSAPEPAQTVQSAPPARRPETKKTASKSPKKVAPAGIEAEQAERLDQLVWTLSSPEHSLDQQHDRISKLTLELPIPLVDVLNRWELDQVRRTGRRLYRERLIDLALAELPTDMDMVVTMARDLPAWLKYAETEQVGSRVRAPVALELKVMKQELKLRREKGTYVRHIYAVALLNFLTSYGVPVEEPTP